MSIPAKAYIHVDVDSPDVLHKFYGIDYTTDLQQSEDFYKTTFDRAFALFEKHKIKATFFLVGNELEKSDKINNKIKEAVSLGHSIANHTYSHPFGLCNLGIEEIKNEIEKCDTIIKELTGIQPIGFRTPGYAVNSTIIKVLSQLNYKYDSSAGWPLIHQILLGLKILKPITGMKMDVGHGETNIRFYNEPYYTSSENWRSRSPGNKEEIMEYPLPHSYKLLPYYNNILLGSSHKRIEMLSNGLHTSNLIFLMHQIEFCDSADKFVPKSIYKHPNVLQNNTSKCDKMDFTFNLLKNKYNFSLLEDEF